MFNLNNRISTRSGLMNVSLGSTNHSGEDVDEEINGEVDEGSSGVIEIVVVPQDSNFQDQAMLAHMEIVEENISESLLQPESPQSRATGLRSPGN